METALINQKDKLLFLVNNGEFERALDLLEFVTPLWESISYGYKAREIRERIVREIDEQLWTAEHWKTKERLQRIRSRAS